eukprot:GEMP01046643.1.p1 GENE.GEMP01046643.1~~GEMP01046643.1.p1  ORF type:complete len:325 (+),score=71.30 GEMP01046643.1:160-1134(+)
MICHFVVFTLALSHIALPPRVIAAYTGGASSDQLRRAIDVGGVNVLLWSFLTFQRGTIRASINRTTYSHIAATYPHVVHFASLGGWNAPHPTPLDSSLFLTQWRRWNRDFGFHGLDWDIEGNDDAASSENHINTTLLEFMTATSRTLQQEDGLLISIVPAQSYLDAGTHAFDPRGSLLHADAWAPSFHYHGRNTYAPLLLAQHTRLVPDMVIVQLYETYSRTWAEYSASYLDRLAYNMTTGWEIDFAGCWGLHRARITVNRTTLVFGLANWWGEKNPKVFFRQPRDIPWPTNVRGFAYWCVAEDGDVPFTRDWRERGEANMHVA